MLKMDIFPILKERYRKAFNFGSICPLLKSILIGLSSVIMYIIHCRPYGQPF